MATKKPNIIVLWGDDIGQFNISAYNRGMMGYTTPNIDRIANEDALFTDGYGQQRCTACRAAGVGQWRQSSRECPPRQKPGSFNLDRVMDSLTEPNGG